MYMLMPEEEEKLFLSNLSIKIVPASSNTWRVRASHAKNVFDEYEILTLDIIATKTVLNIKDICINNNYEENEEEGAFIVFCKLFLSTLIAKVKEFNFKAILISTLDNILLEQLCADNWLIVKTNNSFKARKFICTT